MGDQWMFYEKGNPQNNYFVGKGISEEDKLKNQLTQEQINQTRAETAKLVKGKGEADLTVSPYKKQKEILRTLQSVDELLLKAKANKGIFGRTALGCHPGFLRSDAYRNFEAELNTLKANITFGELIAMREAAKTGGASGQCQIKKMLCLKRLWCFKYETKSREFFKNNF